MYKALHVSQSWNIFLMRHSFNVINQEHHYKLALSSSIEFMVNVHYTKRKPRMKCKSKTFSCRGQKEVNHFKNHFIFAELKCDGMSHPHPTEHRSCPTTSEAAVASTSKIRVPLQPDHNVIEPSSSGVCVLSDTDSGVADTASEDGRSASRASAASKKMSSSDLQPLRDPEHYEELSVIGNGKHGGFHV